MEAVGLLPQYKILQKWWQEVNGNFWQEDAKPQVLKLVKELMESTMNEELVLHTGTRHYERSDNRISYRNGSYKRALVTQFGTIPDVKVPTLRKASFKTKVFKRESMQILVEIDEALCILSSLNLSKMYPHPDRIVCRAF